MSAADHRDHSLRRVSRLTGWLAAAGLVAVGGFAGLLARPQHSSASTSTGTAASGSATQSLPSAQSQTTAPKPGKSSANSNRSSTPPVTRPAQPPRSSQSRGPAVSGGS